MQQLKPIIFLLLLSNPLISFSQDTIYFSQQTSAIVKVIEIEETHVKYRKIENLEGPLYTVAKNEILSIHYQNGNRDDFNLAKKDIEQLFTKENFLNQIKSPQLNVFVLAPDSGSLIHARNALHNATTWKLVSDQSNAQLVVRFVFVGIGLGDKKGKAQFLVPNTETILFETKMLNTAMSMDINTKRGVIDKVVNKEIKKLLKE